MSRHYSIFDNAIINFNNALRTVLNSNATAARSYPAQDLPETLFDKQQRKTAASLMRVNHVGEVCAQALYQGQALTARSNKIKEKFAQAAQEENDHLAWCRQRINELNGRVSYLNPVWYFSSLMIGVMAGLISDEINLGFLAETEHQVEQHLTEHLQQLPSDDQKSRKILEQMRMEELQHAHSAEQAGAAELPAVIKFAMSCLSKIMKSIAYWI